MHDANTPAQDRCQLGVAELVYGAMVVDRRVDYLHGLAFEAIGYLLERPGLLVLDRALDKLRRNDATGGRHQIGIPAGFRGGTGGRLQIGMHGRLRRNPQLGFVGYRQSELKRSTLGYVRGRPHSPPMRFDDGTADR